MYFNGTKLSCSKEAEHQIVKKSSQINLAERNCGIFLHYKGELYNRIFSHYNPLKHILV